MKFGVLDLTKNQVDDLYLLLGHCSGETANLLVAEIGEGGTEPEWDRVEPIIEIERSHIIQFELHLKESTRCK